MLNTENSDLSYIPTYFPPFKSKYFSFMRLGKYTKVPCNPIKRIGKSFLHRN